MSAGIRAMHHLAKLGYRAWVDGDVIRFRYEGEGGPIPEQVEPLFTLVRQYKDEVKFFLKCHCPRCDGICFVPGPDGLSLCMACDWELLTQLYPALRNKN